MSELPHEQKIITFVIHSLTRKAQGKNELSYLQLFFLRLGIAKYSRDKVLQDILNIVEPSANTENSELLNVRQKIILEIEKMGSSFV